MNWSTIWIATAMLGAAVLPAFPQRLPFGGAEGNANQGTINFSPSIPVHITQVIGAPYSGQDSTETVETLADGTHLTQPGREATMTYRDSMGRVRTERSIPRVLPFTFTVVQVADPVTGYFYVIDSVNQVAHRMVAQSSGPSKPNSPSPAGRTLPDGTEITVESFGTSTILGVPVVGTKTTTTYPIGSRLGNDRTVTATDESWTSPQLGLLISSTSSDRGIVTTRTMKNLSTAEPDPAFFTVPAGYKLLDETGRFTIKVTKQN